MPLLEFIPDFLQVKQLGRGDVLICSYPCPGNGLLVIAVCEAAFEKHPDSTTGTNVVVRLLTGADYWGCIMPSLKELHCLHVFLSIIHDVHSRP